MKNNLSNELSYETKELREDILGVKQYFDEQKDHVTQFETTINFLKRQAKMQKKEVEDANLGFRKELEGYRLEILKNDSQCEDFAVKMG